MAQMDDVGVYHDDVDDERSSSQFASLPSLHSPSMKEAGQSSVGVMLWSADITYLHDETRPQRGLNNDDPKIDYSSPLEENGV